MLDNWNNGLNASIVRKAGAVNEAKDSPLSKSLLDLLPSHVNNVDTPVQTMIRENDAEVLYSYDTVKSPGARGRELTLGGLVDMAEREWTSQQTERIVKGEYEVLDHEGESTVISSGKGNKRGSPKQKATKVEPAVPVIKKDIDEDDGFELI
jgi:hypothetical protein